MELKAIMLGEEH